MRVTGPRRPAVRTLSRSLIPYRLLTFVALWGWTAGALALSAQEIAQIPHSYERLQVRYRAAEAGEVFLVWGINGWGEVREDARPEGTTIRNAVMHSPMRRAGDVFVVDVVAPRDATINYGFLVTRRREGGRLEAWEGRDDFNVTAGQGRLLEVASSLDLSGVRTFAGLRGVLLTTALGLCVVIGVAYAVARLPHLGAHRPATLALAGITFLALVLRVHEAVTTERLLATPPQLIGDEPSYDALATSLLNGEFFRWPGRTPVYPLFLAAGYLVFGHSYAAVLLLQALVATATVPLTYRLAREFTDRRGSLFAAALVALSPALIFQVGYLYTEALFTLLVLLSVLVLLWALRASRLRRFLAAGAMLGVCTLCRPATPLMPLVLPLILPRRWSVATRAIVTAVFLAGMFAVIAPWTLHNYRTHHAFVPLQLAMSTPWQGSPEFYHLMKHKPNLLLTMWDEELNPERNGGHDPFTVEGDRYFTRRAVASIRAEPAVFAWYSLQKLAFFWIGHPAAHWDWPFDFDVIRRSFSAPAIAGVFVARLLLVLAAVVALVVLRRRVHEFAPLIAVCAYMMAFHALIAPIARYSEPLYPILAVFIGAAFTEASRRLRLLQPGGEA